MRIATYILLWAMLCWAPVYAQQPGDAEPAANTPAATAPAATTKAKAPAAAASSAISDAIVPSVILLQSEIAGQPVFGTAVIVQSGEKTSQAVTTYEAIKGAASIQAVVPEQGQLMAHLLKFAPEANIALLEIPCGGLPVAPLGDSELLTPKSPIEMVTAIPLQEGNKASARDTIMHDGTVQAVTPRPTGSIIKLSFTPGIADDSTGAAVVAPNSGEVMGLAMSLEASQVDTMRFCVPINLVSSLSPSIATAKDSVVEVRVLDGSEAPVLDGSATTEEGQQQQDNSTFIGMIVTIVIAVIIVIAGGVVMLRKRNAVKPFSFIPRLPEGQLMAFVTAEGRFLPMDKDEILVGRAEDCDWMFPDSTVSGHHAKIRKNRSGNGYEVEDRNSTNGTFIGHRKIGRSDTILPGNIVRFGKTVQVMLVTKAQSTED